MKNDNTKEEQRKADRRVTPDRRSSSAMRAAAGDRREGIDNRDVVAAMGDALEDILAWERASERSLKAADAVVSTNDVNTSR